MLQLFVCFPLQRRGSDCLALDLDVSGSTWLVFSLSTHLSLVHPTFVVPARQHARWLVSLHQLGSTVLSAWFFVVDLRFRSSTWHPSTARPPCPAPTPASSSATWDPRDPSPRAVASCPPHTAGPHSPSVPLPRCVCLWPPRRWGGSFLSRVEKGVLGFCTSLCKGWGGEREGEHVASIPWDERSRWDTGKEHAGDATRRT